MTMQPFENDGPRVPFGDWFEDLVGWCSTNLQGLFDVIERPFRWTLDLVSEGERVSHSMPPRAVVIVVLGVLAYTGGGIRRAAYVVGSVGVMALMGNRMWAEATYTLYALLVALAATAFVTLAVVATVRGRSASLSHVGTGWGWVQPFALVVPGIFFFGIGEVTAVILTTLYVTPIAIMAAVARPASTKASSFHNIARRTQVGVRAAVQPALIAITIFAFLGIGGLPQFLLQAINTQELALALDASLGIWLVGFTAWNLLGPWSFDHLPGRTATKPAELEPASEEHSLPVAPQLV